MSPLQAENRSRASRAIEELNVYTQWLHRSDAPVVRKFQHHCEKAGTWLNLDSISCPPEFITCWSQAMGEFDSDGVSKPSRQSACCEFMSTPPAWDEAWSKVSWRPHHPMLPQKRELHAGEASDPSRGKCLLIPNLMWYIYGKECIWGAINFNAP